MEVVQVRESIVGGVNAVERNSPRGRDDSHLYINPPSSALHAQV